jgi:hypothetical protein
MNCRQNVFLETPVVGMRSSRKPGEKHKDKEQDAYTFYSTEALIMKIARVKHSQAHFAPAKQ